MSTLSYVAYAGGLTLVEELAAAIGRDNTTRGNEDEELKLYFSNWVHFDYVLIEEVLQFFNLLSKELWSLITNYPKTIMYDRLRELSPISNNWVTVKEYTF